MPGIVGEDGSRHCVSTALGFSLIFLRYQPSLYLPCLVSKGTLCLDPTTETIHMPGQSLFHCERIIRSLNFPDANLSKH